MEKYIKAIPSYEIDIVFITIAMKPVYFLLIFFTLASAELQTWRTINTGDINVDLNKLVDKFNPYIEKFMLTHGLDPFQLADNVLKFPVKLPIIPIIHFDAELTLRAGTLKYLSKLQRYNDASLVYDGKQLKLDVGVEFTSLEGSHDYALKVLRLSSTGHVTPTVNNLRCTISVIFNTKDYTLTLNSFKIDSLNKIKADVQTKHGLGWLVTPITNVVLPFFKSEITRAIEVEVVNTIQAYMNQINPIPRKVLARILEYQLVERYFDEENDVLA